MFSLDRLYVDTFWPKFLMLLLHFSPTQKKILESLLYQFREKEKVQVVKSKTNRSGFYSEIKFLATS